MKVLGLDGFRNGWVTVSFDGSTAAIGFHGHVADALAGSFERAAIDIPIGMSVDGERLCDRLACDALHPHRSRVFTGARRWLWEEFDDPDKANAEALRRCEKRASRQLWHIGRKIMEVDAFVRSHPQLEIREAHPELVFRRLNAGRPLPSKKSGEGLSMRRALLRRTGFEQIDDWLGAARRGTGAKADDVLDACVVAVAALQPGGCLPEKPIRDAYDLPMQIWF